MGCLYWSSIFLISLIAFIGRASIGVKRTAVFHHMNLSFNYYKLTFDVFFTNISATSPGEFDIL